MAAVPAGAAEDNELNRRLRLLLASVEVGDRVRGDLLQDCWWLMKVAIAHWNWERLPAWQIPRLSLNLQAPTALTG